jgi:hypothetical protein
VLVVILLVLDIKTDQKKVPPETKRNAQKPIIIMALINVSEIEINNKSKDGIEGEDFNASFFTRR